MLFLFSFAKIGQKQTSIVDITLVFNFFFFFLQLLLSFYRYISFSFDCQHFLYFYLLRATGISRKLAKKNFRKSSIFFKLTMGSDTSKSKKHPTQLTQEEIQLLLKNTHFNRQQILEWHQGFLVRDNRFFLSSNLLLSLFVDKYSHNDMLIC